MNLLFTLSNTEDDMKIKHKIKQPPGIYKVIKCYFSTLDRIV